MGLFDKIMDDWLGDPFGSYEAEAGAKRAAQTQAQMADAGIAEQRRQFDISNQLQRQMYEQGRQIMNPYVQAGYQAIGAPSVPYSPLATQPQQATFGTNATMGGFGSTVTPSVFRQKPSHVGTVAPGASAPQSMPATFAGGPRTLGFYQEGATAGMPILGEFATRGAEAGRRQAALAGLGTPEDYMAEVAKVESDPAFQEMLRQSEEGILQNAAATGGLRGGRVQSALAQLRPALLSQFLSDRYSKLGGLAGTGLSTGQYLTDIGRATTGQLAQLGQASAAGQAAAGTNLASNLGALGQSMSSNVGSLLQQKGAALAGGQMASGSGAAGTLGPLLKLGATVYGAS